MAWRAPYASVSLLFITSVCLAVLIQGSDAQTDLGGLATELIEGTVTGVAQSIGGRRVGLDVTNRFTLKRSGDAWELRVFFTNGGNEWWVHKDGYLYGLFDLPLSPESVGTISQDYTPPLNAVARTGSFPNEGFVTTKFIWYVFASDQELAQEYQVDNLILPWLQGMLPGARAFTIDTSEDRQTLTRELRFRHAEGKWQREIVERRRDPSQLSYRDAESIGTIHITRDEDNGNRTTATLTRFHPTKAGQTEAMVPAIELMIHARRGTLVGQAIDIPALDREATVVDYRLAGSEQLLNVIYSLTNGVWLTPDDPILVAMFAAARTNLSEVKQLLFPGPPQRRPIAVIFSWTVIVLLIGAPLAIWLYRMKHKTP